MSKSVRALNESVVTLDVTRHVATVTAVLILSLRVLLIAFRLLFHFPPPPLFFCCQARKHNGNFRMAYHIFFQFFFLWFVRAVVVVVVGVAVARVEDSTRSRKTAIIMFNKKSTGVGLGCCLQQGQG